MTTPQKAFLTAGIIVQSLLLVDLVGMEHQIQQVERLEFRPSSQLRYARGVVGRPPVGILSSGGVHSNSVHLQEVVKERFWWYSGFNVGATLVMLAIWRRKKTADA